MTPKKSKEPKENPLQQRIVQIALAVAIAGIIGGISFGLQVYRDVPALKTQMTTALADAALGKKASIELPKVDRELQEMILWVKGHDEEIGANTSAMLKLSTDRAAKCENLLQYIAILEIEIERLKNGG